MVGGGWVGGGGVEQGGGLNRAFSKIKSFFYHDNTIRNRIYGGTKVYKCYQC